MTQKTTLLNIFIFTFLSLSIILAGCNTTTEQTYKIGTIVPLTGAGSTLGIPMVNGMSLAVEEINANGGIQGHQLKLKIEDGKLDGKESVSAVNYLLHAENPDVITTLFHLPAQAINPILKKAKKPFIYEAFTRSILDNPYAFKANFDALEGCEELVKYAKEQNKYKKLGVLVSRTEYNELCVQGIKKVEPDIEEYWYTFGETDFKTLLAQAHNAGVDALITIAIDFEYVNIFQQLSELGYPIKMMCATAFDCIFPGVIETASDEVLEGTMGIDFVPLDIPTSSFAKKYAKKYGKSSQVSYVYGAIGYEEVMYISKAMEQCQPNDSECLATALKEVKGYTSVLNSKGFVDNVLQTDREIYEFRNGQWVSV